MRISKSGRRWVLAITAASVIVVTPNQAQQQTPESSKVATPKIASHFPQYEDVTQKSKIQFRQSFGEQKLSSILESTGTGCAWFDYNNDGLLDLYVVSGRFLEGVTEHSKADGKDATNHLYPQQRRRNVYRCDGKSRGSRKGFRDGRHRRRLRQ